MKQYLRSRVLRELTKPSGAPRLYRYLGKKYPGYILTCVGLAGLVAAVVVLNMASSVTAWTVCYGLLVVGAVGCATALLNELGAGQIGVKRLAQITQTMQKHPEISEAYASWWPQNEVLRRRDWVRIQVAGAVLSWASERPPRLPRSPPAPTPCWTEQSRSQVAGLLARYANLKGQPRPAVPASMDKATEKLMQSVMAQPPKPVCGPGWKGHLLRWGLPPDDHKGALALVTVLMLATIPWMIASTLVLVASSGLDSDSFFNPASLSIAAWAFCTSSLLWLLHAGFCAWTNRTQAVAPWPPAIKQINDLAHDEPVLAWLLANKPLDQETLSQADAYVLLQSGRRVQKWRYKEYRHQHRQAVQHNEAKQRDALLNSMPMRMMAEAKREAEVLSATVPPPTQDSVPRRTRL